MYKVDMYTCTHVKKTYIKTNVYFYDFSKSTVRNHLLVLGNYNISEI